MTQRFDVGVQFLREKQYDRAASAFLEVVRDSPAHAAAWSNYGIALSHLGRAAEAEAALGRAIGLQPENPETWFHLGVARSQRDEWGEAASAYRRAVALAPNDVVAWHRLGVALAESGDEAAGSVAFERALVLSRDQPTVSPTPDPSHVPVIDDHTREGGEREGGREAKSWLDLALSLLTLGEEEEAIAAYERAYTLDPQRAGHSLFKPMLSLLTSIEGNESDSPTSAGAPTGPDRPEGLRPPVPRAEIQ